MPSRFAFSLVVVTCLAWSSADASLLDTVVPEETPGSGLSAKPNHLHPLALIATDAITTELVSMKKSAPSNAGVARIEEMIQDMNKESADPVSSHRCDAKSTADQASCSAKTTKAGCESVVDSDSKQKCKYQMDGGTKDMEDRLTTAKTAINSAVSTMLDGLTADYDNAKKDLKVMDDAIDNSKRTVSPTDFEAIKTKATTWCSKKRALETATSDAGTAASTLTEKLNAPLDLSDVKINEVGAIGSSTCSNTNGNAKDSTCPAASCNLASRIQSKIDTANGEYLAASWDKAEKDALKSTATTDESDSKGEFQAAVTTTASTYHTMCDSNDQLHDTAVNLFNNNNVGRASMYRSLGVIQCHINHMKSGQTLNVPTNLLKSGEAATSTSATNCVGKLKADSAIKTDLFPDASSTEDSSKTCPLLSAYEADIRNYGSLGFDKDDADWSATTTKCDAVTAHAATGVARTYSEWQDNGQSGECDGASGEHLAYVTGDSSSLQKCQEGCDAIGAACIAINYAQNSMCEISGGDVCPSCGKPTNPPHPKIENCNTCTNYHWHGFDGAIGKTTVNGQVKCYRPAAAGPSPAPPAPPAPQLIVDPTSTAGGCCHADQTVTNTITAPQAASQVKFTLYQADNRNKPIKDVKFRCRDNAYQTLQASQITVNNAGREFTVDTPVTQGQLCDIQYKSIVGGSDHYTKVVYGTGYSSTVVGYGGYHSLNENNDGFMYNVKEIEFN